MQIFFFTSRPRPHAVCISARIKNASSSASTMSSSVEAVSEPKRHDIGVFFSITVNDIVNNIKREYKAASASVSVSSSVSESAFCGN